MKLFCKHFLIGGGEKLKSTLAKSAILSLALGMTATSCDKEENTFLQDAKLKLNVSMNKPASRAIITDDYLPSGSEIGITLQGTDYDQYQNVKFTATGSAWNGDDILMTRNKATLYAYYPWMTGTQLDNIPVETASQTDYLFATPVSGTDYYFINTDMHKTK